MEKKENKKHRFGLIGKNISYSFSKGYFTQKFSDLDLPDYSYENFDFQEIDAFKSLLSAKDIIGCNVTIPYKEAIISFLSDLNPKAKAIGAVNTIKFTKNGPVGYNTDAYGFQKSIEPHLKKQHSKALILGTGGASKAVQYVLEELDIHCVFVSRNPKENQFSYTDLNKKVMNDFTVIVNCTPLGTHPNIEQKPDIPYKHLSKRHLLFDLIYNPEKTTFLTLGEAEGALICNGHKMLEYQAEKAWEIWSES